MLQYKFFVFSILFLFPGLFIYLLRRDLRPVIQTMAILALPFAFTEWMFYPTYWEPVFLFDLIHLIGFGIEDILFVAGLASFASTAYAFFSRKSYKKEGESTRKQLLIRTGLFLSVVFTLVTLLFLMKIKMIYGSVAIMVTAFIFIGLIRKELFFPGILGGIFTLVIYSTLCVVISWIFPKIFDLTWHTERFLNLFVFGIPIEEILYATAAGMVATVFYPYIFKKEFISKNPTKPTLQHKTEES